MLKTMKKNSELFKIYKFIYEHFRIFLLVNILVFSTYFIIASKLFKNYYQTEIVIGSKGYFELMSNFEFADVKLVLKNQEFSIPNLIFENFLNNLKSIETKKQLTNKFNIKNNIDIEINHRKLYSDAIISSKSEDSNLEKILEYAIIVAEQKTIDFLKIRKNEIYKSRLIDYYSIKSTTVNKLYEMKNIIILFLLNIILFMVTITIRQFKKII